MKAGRNGLCNQLLFARQVSDWGRRNGNGIGNGLKWFLEAWYNLTSYGTTNRGDKDTQERNNTVYNVGPLWVSLCVACAIRGNPLHSVIWPRGVYLLVDALCTCFPSSKGAAQAG